MGYEFNDKGVEPHMLQLSFRLSQCAPGQLHKEI